MLEVVEVVVPVRGRHNRYVLVQLLGHLLVNLNRAFIFVSCTRQGVVTWEVNDLGKFVHWCRPLLSVLEHN